MGKEYYSDIVEYNNQYWGRIGGNIPELLISSVSRDFYFYATLPHPNKEGIMFSIFTPKCFDMMNSNNIYPNCSIKVIVHEFSIESSNQDFSNPSLSRMSISDYKELEKEYYLIREINQENFNNSDGEFDELEEPYHSIVIGREAILIQNDEMYAKKLIQDGYKFFMQIDESGMPNSLIKKDYIFGYGALYLYSRSNNEEIIAGFWQN
ncbi:hypothetical protein E4T80_12210 [Muribacter muris]|uniref:DUF1963 domain-containing protein n=1 Tax=Muribacter muris TaxID=67855 RepID=A0A4Y9JSM8_9PAST|nr:hypothetical protein [Muribacter muris]MBF0786227.1 hypothetical protein [Muribacter muris]MBF0827776.1 hypothetical protein [Muribacter muris]TFV07497.1 hypothetical protein E4T80_12210 [Muribacter muris]